MTLPQVIVEVGLTGPEVSTDVFVLTDPVRGVLGTGELGSSGAEVWTDISTWVRRWSVVRGSKRGDDPTLRYDTGTLTVELNDGDRRFDPDNLAGPYALGGVTLLTPMRRIRIRAVWDGVTYPIIAGYVDDWQADYQANSWTYATVTGSDALSYFAGIDRLAISPVGAGEDAGARVNRILDSVAWPAADRSIATGDTTLQATTLADNALTELLLVQDTELGELYVDATGTVVFRNRRAMLTEARSNTSQATFGDAEWARLPSYDFEAGVAGWNVVSGGTAGPATVAYSGSGALELVVSGSPTQAYVRPSSDVPVVEGRRYQVTMRVRASASTLGAIDWKDASHGYLSGVYPSPAVLGGDWTLITVSGVAPAGAAFMSFGPTLDSSPANGTALQLDDVELADLDAEIPYWDAKPSSLVESLANTVTASIAGGTAQVVQDTASVANYLVKTHQRLDLLGETDDMALSWANAIAYQYATPRRRWESLSFNTPAVHVEDVHWPAVLGREFGDRITVIRRPAGGGDPIVRDCFVRGVSHQSDGQSWTTSFVLQSADRYSFFVLGDANLGVLGSNALAF